MTHGKPLGGNKHFVFKEIKRQGDCSIESKEPRVIERPEMKALLVVKHLVFILNNGKCLNKEVIKSDLQFEKNFSGCIWINNLRYKISRLVTVLFWYFV